MGSLDDFGKLTLRVALGVLLLFHGAHKVLDGIEPIKDMIIAHGLPDALAYGAYLGEIIAPVLVILGVFSRVGAAIIAIYVIVSVALTQMGALLTIAPTGGYGLELEAMYVLAAVAIVFLGAGRFALSHSSHWN